jgi:hypothetical protein
MAVNSALRAAFNCPMTFSLPRICTLLPLARVVLFYGKLCEMRHSKA